jgi:tRNA threonylcarbamoyl adenosine modification protein YjeE
MALGCSEAETRRVAAELALLLKPGDRVFLEGELGAGKTTFARALLESLSIDQRAEGSPTFPIAHEYSGASGDVIHIDFYRLKREAELDEAGITAYFWEREAIVLCEWISLFPNFRDAVLRSSLAAEVPAHRRGRAYRVTLGRIPSSPDRRDIRIERLATGKSLGRE